jgi:hypothetical protein
MMLIRSNEPCNAKMSFAIDKSQIMRGGGVSEKWGQRLLSGGLVRSVVGEPKMSMVVRTRGGKPKVAVGGLVLV